MNSNLKEDILAPAWEIVKNDLRIKLFYFLPGLLSVIFLTILLLYQTIYTYVKIFDKKHEIFLIILKFFESDYVLEVLVSAIVFFTLYVFIIPVFEWWLIKYIDSKQKLTKVWISDSIWLGLYKFLPLFEYNNSFSMFRLISIVNAFLFCLRFFWLSYFNLLFIIFFILFLFSIIINIFFEYTKYEIILWNKKVLEAMSSSFKLTTLNLKNTVELYFIMFILNIRVIINFFIFLTFPIIIISLIWFITSKIFLTISLIIIWFIFVALIWILWYLAAVLDVFKTAIWYFAYIKGLERLKEMEE